MNLFRMDGHFDRYVGGLLLVSSAFPMWCSHSRSFLFGASFYMTRLILFSVRFSKLMRQMD
ncbi:hypothetical protein BJV74DRAFT_839527, partial [Russula compacta]